MQPFSLNDEEIAHIKLLRSLPVAEYEMVLQLVVQLSSTESVHLNLVGTNVVMMLKPLKDKKGCG